MKRRDVAISLCTMLAAGGAVQAGDTGTVMAKPDFSEVKSVAAAQRLEAEGKLVKILLFPSEFGGEDIPPNVVYITPEAAKARVTIIGTLSRLVSEGTLDRMTVNPLYRGDSVVPTRIQFHASHSTKPGTFDPVLEVW